MERRATEAQSNISLTLFSVLHPREYDIPISPRLLSLPSLSLHVGPFPRATIDQVRSEAIHPRLARQA